MALRKMNKKKSLLTTKLLLSHFLGAVPARGPAFLGEELQAWQSLGTPSGTPEGLWREATVVKPDLGWPSAVHPSWWKGVFSKFPAAWHEALLGVLPRASAQAVAAALQVTMPTSETSPGVREFLQKKLREAYFPDNVIPLDLLPESPLQGLLAMSSGHLLYLIELLGLRDLAYETLQVVDQKRLQTVRALLSPSWQKALATYQKRPDSMRPRSLLLPSWDGKASSLQKIIQHYGLSRLSKALAGQHYSFVWHLARKLDQHLMRHFLEAVPVKAIPMTTELLKGQVLELVSLFEKK